MNSYRSNDYSDLDRIRLEKGADTCRADFRAVFLTDPRRSAKLLNDYRLTFPCLYILLEQAETLRTQGYLNQRNIIALGIARQIEHAGAPGNNYLSSKRGQVYSALKWILKTGAAEDIPENAYEKILDVTVSVLINTYGDRDILPTVSDLIFRRNRSGRYVHDLVWALFRVHDPRVLKLIAEGIRSIDPKDVALAAELLNIDDADVQASESGRGKKYEDYLRWLSENDPFLYFTGESFQYSSRPAFSALDRERKYLQEGTASYDRHELKPSDEEAGQILAAFKQLGAEKQTILSEYSKGLHDKSVPAWSEWLHAPVGEQIEAAKAGLEKS